MFTWLRSHELSNAELTASLLAEVSLAVSDTLILLQRCTLRSFSWLLVYNTQHWVQRKCQDIFACFCLLEKFLFMEEQTERESKLPKSLMQAERMKKGEKMGVK